MNTIVDVIVDEESLLAKELANNNLPPRIQNLIEGTAVPAATTRVVDTDDTESDRDPDQETNQTEEILSDNEEVKARSPFKKRITKAYLYTGIDDTEDKAEKTKEAKVAPYIPATTENIHSYLAPLDPNEQKLNPLAPNYKTKERFFVSLIKDLLAVTERVTGKENKKVVVATLMKLISAFREFLHVRAISKFTVIVKAKFHEFIVDGAMHELIPIYNTIFNDKLYASKDSLVLPRAEISEEEIKRLIDKYNNDVKNLYYRRAQMRPAPKFEEGEIVGAKDKDGKWWLSRILKIFTHLEHNMYYVSFEGWGDKFNEFIIDSYRIAKFDPRKHIYYRPSWKAKIYDAKARVAKPEEEQKTELTNEVGQTAGQTNDETEQTTDLTDEELKHAKDLHQAIIDAVNKVMNGV